MPFLVGTDTLPAAVINSTGTFIRFRKSQRPNLPAVSQDVRATMPDGVVVSGQYTATAAFPYIRGPEPVHWIKAWLASGETRNVVVTQEARGIRVSFDVAGSAVPAATRRLARRKAIRFAAGRKRTRQTYERWERDPTIKAVVLDVWGRRCQVPRCGLAAGSGGHFADRLVDVHHLRFVSDGGDDSPLNLAVLCVMHHALVHRGPRATVEFANLDRATIAVNGITLHIRRDGRALMAAFQP